MPHMRQGDLAQVQPERLHPKPAQRKRAEGTLALPCMQGRDLQVTSQPQGPYEPEAQKLRCPQGTRSEPPGSGPPAPLVPLTPPDQVWPIEDIPLDSSEAGETKVITGSQPLARSQGPKKVTFGTIPVADFQVDRTSTTEKKSGAREDGTPGPGAP